MLSTKKLLLMKLGAAQIRPQDVWANRIIGGTSVARTANAGFAPDLSWMKGMNATVGHSIFDRVRGGSKVIRPNTTNAEYDYSPSSAVTFGPSGTAYGSFEGDLNSDNVVWLGKKSSNFMDIQTWTGDGFSGRKIFHALGSAPGMIIVHRLDAGGYGWPVYHRSAGPSFSLMLNATSAWSEYTYFPEVTAKYFSLTAGDDQVNGLSGRYVAYIFAHNPDLVSCGVYYGTGGSLDVTLGNGWAPQFLMLKKFGGIGAWYILDDARGFSSQLRANLDAPTGSFVVVMPTATGFRMNTSGTEFNQNGGLYGYLAIRAPT